MNRITLKKLEEKDERLIPGEVIGEILISDGGFVEVLVPDRDIKSRIEAIIAQGLTVQSGDPLGIRNVTYERTITPNDPHYARALIERLEQIDFRITGALTQ